MEKRQFFSARNIAYLAVLLALVIVLQLFASAIPMFGVTLNFSLVPIVLAGIFFGMWGGALLGLVSGLITFLTAAVMGQEPSTAFLFQASPVLLTLTCIGKTTIAGLAAGFLYRVIAKKSALAASYVAAVVVALLNTGLYLLGIVFMKDAASQYLGTEATAGAVFIAVFALVWLNFVLETVINVLFAPAICRIEKVVNSKVLRYRADREERSKSADMAKQDAENEGNGEVGQQEAAEDPPTEDKT